MSEKSNNKENGTNENRGWAQNVDKFHSNSSTLRPTNTENLSHINICPDESGCTDPFTRKAITDTDHINKIKPDNTSNNNCENFIKDTTELNGEENNIDSRTENNGNYLPESNNISEKNLRQTEKQSNEKNSQKYPIRSSVYSISSFACRICHTNEQNERLISPCLCKGTLAYVHKDCLEHWLNTSGLYHCELCQYQFQTENKLRYNLFESLGRWYRHPNNRSLLQADFFVCVLLSVVTFGLIAVCMVGLQYFILQENYFGFSKPWTYGSVVAYVVNIVIIIKSQLVPWYRWWRSARLIRLILTNQDTIPDQSRNKIKNIEQEVQTVELSAQACNNNPSSYHPIETV